MMDAYLIFSPTSSPVHARGVGTKRRRNWVSACAAMGAATAMFLLSACEVSDMQTPAKEEHIKVEPVLEVPVLEAASHYIVILQDGVDAFLRYKIIDIPAPLSGEYATLNDGILAVLNAYNLREMANEEGVTAYAKIKTSKNDETTWSFELLNLPDFSVKAKNYKVYFAKIDDGFKIAQIGQRFKCYRNPNPDDQNLDKWTTELCP